MLWFVQAMSGARKTGHGVSAPDRLSAERCVGIVTGRTPGTMMIIAFQTETLRRICEDDTVATAQLGAPVARALRERLSDVRAASTIEDLFVGRPRLSGPREELLTIDLGTDARSVWTANHVQLPVTEDGLVDWTRTTRVRLTSIEGG